MTERIERAVELLDEAVESVESDRGIQNIRDAQQLLNGIKEDLTPHED